MHKIAINALGLKNNAAGVETYVYNLIKHLALNDEQNKYFVFMGKNVEYIFRDLKQYPNMEFVFYPLDTNNSLHRIIFENTVFAVDLLIKKVELVHHVGNYIPYFCPVKSIATLHDMVAFYYRENHPEYPDMEKFYNYFKKAMEHTAGKAVKILPNSEFTRKEFLKYFDVNENKVNVIRHSIDTRQKSGEKNEEKLKKYDIKKPYILAVSAIRPHKNFDFLVRVFNRLKEKYNIPHQLVVIGKNDFGYEKFLSEKEKSPFKQDIIRPGYVESKDMASLYGLCDMMVFPSLYEGFGVPVLEAMQYEIPVLASNAASLPEVGGDACLFFDPCDEVDASNKIYSVISDAELRETLVSRQKNRLEKFNWNDIAEDYIDVYKGILKGNTDE